MRVPGFWSSSRSRWAWVAVALVLAIAAAGATALGLGERSGSTGAAARGTSGAAAAPAAPAAPVGDRGRPGDVAITGRVLELPQRRPVGGVEVVLRGPAGDATATTRADGSYALRVAPGDYRAFVRGGAVMSIGRSELVRVPDPPRAELAGVPDEGLLAALAVARDTDGVDLAVVRGGSVTGRVIDRAGQPIAGAVVYAVGGVHRPALATDIAASAGDGGFELRLPPGVYDLVASHPRFAGIAGAVHHRYAIGPGTRADATLMLAAGCIVSGRVIGPDGGPVGDGALELQNGSGEADYVPVARIDPDGGFRWATTEDDVVALRAWPWKAPPSPVRQFRCRDGARLDGVVFELPDAQPDVAGVLVDRAGRPVRFAFVDVRPFGPSGIPQQERTDEAGRWEVRSLPYGRYRVTAAAATGVASTTVVSPHDGVRLELGGTGRLDGTTPRLPGGSFELVLDRCMTDGVPIALPQSRRLVAVTGGRFSVGDLPACELDFSVVWRGRLIAQHVAIPAGGTARIDLPLGDSPDKTVRGMVRDAAGQPVAGAVVTASQPDDDARAAAAMTDASGGYTLRTASGATLRAAAHGQVGEARVGGANIDAEQVDLVLGESSGDDPAR